MRRLATITGAVVAVAALLAGCAPASLSGYGGTFTILDDGTGPVLCDTLRESYPPQCDGVSVVEWDWATWPHQEAEGVRWSEYSLTVTPEGDQVRVSFTATPVAE